MATYAEQIAAFEAKRAANVASMKSLMDASAEKGETLDAEGQEQFDELQAENEAVDKHLSRLRAMEKAAMDTAKAVDGQNPTAAGQSRDPRVPAQVKMTEKLEKGVGFARLAKVKALAKLDGESVRTVAKELYGENSAVYGIVSKAAVSAGSTQDGNWAAPLYGEGTDVIADFVEFLRPRTILGRFGQNGIPALRQVPFNVPLVGQTDGGEGYWVGEGRAKPLTNFGFERNILDIYKVASIAVATEELLRRSSPAAEGLLRDSLAAAIIARLDTDFVNPAKAAVAGVSPAAITNGVTPVASTGGDADAIRADIRALMATFIAANNAPTTGVWLMGSTTALATSMMVNPLGQAEFPGITMTGGTFAGMPAIVSDYIPAGTVILANASDIYLADEGGIQVDMSREASLEMADNPVHNSTTPTGATSLVSMFQTNSVAFRVERFINWSRRRPSAVAILTGATWGAAAAPAV
ncbi:phage major capsid protein [Falsirhodobacter sp. 20TX0035]|uniref:phage major capsid protein n=1 Tax=Falsirhodobacter sp. 20TX0035 TaxID=3022019 RepID=UPI00232E8667|nr:phage major capsid protein [Falsirhodobacter sp. 20TX0035]MDB6455008.1 phage major capsid protein [Falsirhodobacter sp. 20TX0035]